LSSIRDLIVEGRKRLEEVPLAEPALESLLLLQKAAGLTKGEVLASPERPVPARTVRAFFGLIEKRRARAPLAYLTGEKEFWSQPFRVFPGVLIPRPETELVVEKVIELSAKRAESIVDVGTGCGAIAVALAGELSSARIIAIDISRRALKAARLNASSRLAGRIRFVEGRAPDVFKSLIPEGSQDFIVSNPPYVSKREWEILAPEIRFYEPKRALVAGLSGLEFIRKLIRGAAVFLKPNGYLVFEIGHGQREAVMAFFDKTWASVRSFEDLAAVPRVVVARKRG